jgi:hypothetical protein
MLSNRLAFAALAVACIGAAAGGGYLASRQTAVPAAAQAATSVPQASIPSSPAASAGTPVQETEAVVGESGGKTASRTITSSAPSPTSAKRVEPPSRAATQPEPAARTRATTAPSPRHPEPLPSLDRTWPSGAAVNSAPVSTANANAPSTPPADAGSAPHADAVAQEAPRTAEIPQKTFEELVVAADSVIGLQAETTVTSERARVEDRVEARVTRDVRVHETVAIPAGARALGTVVSVDRGGKFKERARLGIRFNTLVLADGTRMPISTDTIYREGDAPGKDSAAKMTGAAVGGAILGAIIGGGKGAAIGGAVGAGAGAAGVMATDRSQATLQSGEPITVRILAPVTVTIEQK